MLKSSPQKSIRSSGMSASEQPKLSKSLYSVAYDAKIKSTRRFIPWLVGLALAVVVLAGVSVYIGTASIDFVAIFTGSASDLDQLYFWQSRVPRTLALVLSGSAMSVAGLIMQMLVQNRFVEPSTTGVTEAASLGILIATIWIPTSPIMFKMCFAVLFALVGTMLLMVLIRAVPNRNIIMVPLLGIVFSGVVGAFASFLAWQYQIQGTLAAWQLGDFSGIIAGRFELLYVVGIVAVVAYFFADRFTVIGLGEDLSKNLGLNHRTVTIVGLVIVAIVSGITTVVAGSLPFLGLVIPNLISLICGDYLRKSIPLVALAGASFVLAADIFARLLIMPAEIPVGTVMGVIGAAIFLVFLMRVVRKRG